MASALCYALAFNLSFFVQELFLVLPKAFTPGLHPILFHNNHDWTGHNPLENLFQGTGALATSLMGVATLVWLRSRPVMSPTGRLFTVWLAYCGFFLALPQVVIGAFLPANDVGRAMDWFGLGHGTKRALAVLAIAAMIGIASVLAPQITPAASRTPARDVFLLATLPALLGTILVIPFRVPGNPIEVALVPAFVFLAGLPSIQLFAFRGRGRASSAGEVAIATPALALVALLLVFQLVLRRGIPF